MTESEREQEFHVTQGTMESVTYSNFLNLDNLLRLQNEPHTHDELMFVILHQVHELWFKLMLHEMSTARDMLVAGDLDRAEHLLQRVVVVQQLLAEHWRVLETMLPGDYLVFRWRLQGGSGFESIQYREIEFLAGAKEPGYLDKVRLSTSDQERLIRRLREPSLREAFLGLLERYGVGSVVEIFLADDGTVGRRWALLRVAERLLDFDSAFAQWRTRHTLTVERQIGHKPGTGGSTGAAYLRARIDERFFPELWHARTQVYSPTPGTGRCGGGHT